MGSNSRSELGSLMHMVCFQYLRSYTEEVAGRAPIIAAGRRRGHNLIESLGLLGASTSPELIQERLNEALGSGGTRLCLIERIAEIADGGYEVWVREGACTGGVSASEPICAFTLGAFIGAISAITGQRMTGRETACQACDDPHCVYIIEPI